MFDLSNSIVLSKNGTNGHCLVRLVGVCVLCPTCRVSRLITTSGLCSTKLSSSLPVEVSLVSLSMYGVPCSGVPGVGRTCARLPVAHVLGGETDLQQGYSRLVLVGQGSVQVLCHCVQLQLLMVMMRGGSYLVLLHKLRLCFTRDCCPGPGNSWGNPVVLLASKEADSPSILFCGFRDPPPETTETAENDALTLNFFACR